MFGRYFGGNCYRLLCNNHSMCRLGLEVSKGEVEIHVASKPYGSADGVSRDAADKENPFHKTYRNLLSDFKPQRQAKEKSTRNLIWG